MERKVPSENDILELLVQNYGDTNVIKHYANLLNQASVKMKTASAEQNPMLMAEQNALVREYIRKINSILNKKPKQV